MSQPADGYAAQLGTHADWGLTRESFAPLRDELADHLHCLSDDNAVNSSGAGLQTCDPTDVAAQLSSPKARRALTSTRIADQVYATLHRRPTKQEWREFAWLLFWYALMLASDVLAYRASVAAGQLQHYWIEGVAHPDPASQTIFWSAWLLQGVSRAGFFSAFGLSLWHAWRVGNGVLVARLLQLKLIHVVLVIIAGLIFSSLLLFFGAKRNSTPVDLSWFQPLPYLSGPAWLTAPFIAGALVAAGLLLLWSRKLRALAISCVFLAFFLFPGGPLPSQRIEISETWIKHGFYELENGNLSAAYGPARLSLVDGGYKLVPRVRPDKIDRLKVVGELPNTLENRQRYFDQQSERWHKAVRRTVGVAANKVVWHEEVLTMQPYLHARAWKENQRMARQPVWWQEREAERLKNAKSISSVRLQGPVAAMGAGIGWLAAPIPVLTAVGLVLLICIMGRRNLVAFLLYTVVAAAAMILTITPFFVGQNYSQILQLNPVGIVHSPFPGFETLMLISWAELVSGDLLNVTLILGLLLSSGIPWLLTAMFLKPTNTPQSTSGPELAA